MLRVWPAGYTRVGGGIRELTYCIDRRVSVYMSSFIFYGVFMVLVAKRNIAVHELKKAVGFKFVDGDIHWSKEAAAKLCPAAFLAGASMLYVCSVYA